MRERERERERERVCSALASIIQTRSLLLRWPINSSPTHVNECPRSLPATHQQKDSQRCWVQTPQSHVMCTLYSRQGYQPDWRDDNTNVDMGKYVKVNNKDLTRDYPAGLVVKTSESRAADLGSILTCAVDFFPGRVIPVTGQPGVSVLWLGEIESLMCNCYLSVVTRTLVWADPSLRYSSMLLGRKATNKLATNKLTSPTRLERTWFILKCEGPSGTRHVMSARCVARDLYRIASVPLERVLWRPFAAQWGDR